MRTYLVVVDESEEAETALRFAARRAAKTGGAVEVLVIVRRIPRVGRGSGDDGRGSARKCRRSRGPRL
jgi:nucleotide-binding universal stress UspA family protein